MAEVKITRVKSDQQGTQTFRRWEWPAGSGSHNLDYEVQLNDGDEWFVLTQKEGGPHPAPVVGQSFDATFDNAPKEKGYLAKVKRAPQNRGAFGGGGKSPEEQKSIRRQSAQQRAALYLIAKALLKQHLDQDMTFPAFKTIIDAFEKDAA